ncbi:DUF2680 domain-containing protein [Bacillus sp. FJAT-29953]|nr:DUF2680 domain-containing protein [Bacillus sp. FJAT-29953]
MIIKYVSIVVLFLSYSLMPFQASAKMGSFNKEKTVEDTGSNKESLKKEKSPVNKQPKEDTDDPENENEMDNDLDCTKDIRFTEAQKKRLDQIYHQIYMDYISLIETYAWAGALTQDQKTIRYNMLKNYILTFQKRNYKWCSEYEEDEWEEEWYNSDND